VNVELDRIWKEMSDFKVQSWHLPGGTEENHKNLVKISGLWAKI